ncbi:hypothetical protein VE04_03140 [Pseudogymnoascus sp. 24MN13]|nr:hypothetical protein VE04_03140 [Pseudogymnoascus sp. 24MN13]
MASAPPKAENQLSFARVAASQGKENTALSYAKMAAANPARNAPLSETNESSNKNATGSSRQQTINGGTKSDEQANADEKLADTFNSISLAPSLVVNGSGTDADGEERDIFGEGSAEYPFQRTDSGSDAGTKPPSLDGKSITSGTTFALDEKESLRPDDSASVKAAEDDDTCSGRGSIVAGSRIGSEAAARAYRAQTHEIADRRAVLPVLESRAQGIMTPQSGSSGPPVAGDLSLKPLASPVVAAEGFNLFYKHTPDEKLIEALESPKDRIFLLRLEQDVIEFVKDSKEPFIDLPPCNSFCRMLTHKLADYYHMTHQFDAVAGSVRIFRTPFCRLPQSLTSISNPPTTGHTPPPTVPAMKIMRRGGDNGGSPSKATSETGSDGKDKSLSAKEKLSREEREAAYNKARERIFGNTEKSGDATPDTEDGNDISRSSSVSGKAKRGKMVKKHRTDSESFDVRSQYTPFFPPQQPQPWTPTQPGTIGAPQYTNVLQNSFSDPAVPQYGPTPPHFHPSMAAGGAPTAYHQMPQQFPRPSPPNYQNHGASVPPYGGPMMQNSPQQAGPWPPMGYQAPFQPRGPMPAGQTIPYAYGQLPSTINPADPKSQHPIPGSFNRHAVSPKAQSFVPGNNGAPMPQPLPHQGSPHLQYTGYNTPQQFGNGVGYNMSRQSSNASLPSYHASPHMPPRPMIHQGIINNQIPVPIPNQNNNHLPHFGNMGPLPPKPPPTA